MTKSARPSPKEANWHIHFLGVVKRVVEVGKIVPPRLVVEISRVRVDGVTDHQQILARKQPLDLRKNGRIIGGGKILFRRIRQHLFGNVPVETAARIDQDNILFLDLKVLIREHVAELADLAAAVKAVGAFDIEKQVLHLIPPFADAPRRRLEIL